jgi:hypothetical protein
MKPKHFPAYDPDNKGESTPLTICFPSTTTPTSNKTFSTIRASKCVAFGKSNGRLDPKNRRLSVPTYGFQLWCRTDRKGHKGHPNKLNKVCIPLCRGFLHNASWRSAPRCGSSLPQSHLKTPTQEDRTYARTSGPAHTATNLKAK